MNVFRVHDLLELRTAAGVKAETPSLQAALDACLERARLVVVRRARCQAGWVAVGVRGVGREERYAGLVKVEEVAAIHSPESVRAVAAEDSFPAHEALRMLQERWADAPFAWGPVGSVGFAIVSGRESVTAASDLDVVVRVEPKDISREGLSLLQKSLEVMACRVDVLLETEAGGIALQEAASGVAKVLLRMANGARLVENPWGATGVSMREQEVGR